MHKYASLAPVETFDDDGKKKSNQNKSDAGYQSQIKTRIAIWR
jgi:hypothetical protein